MTAALVAILVVLTFVFLLVWASSSLPGTAHGAAYRYIATKCLNGSGGNVTTWKTSAAPGTAQQLTYRRDTTVPCSGYKLTAKGFILWPEDWWKIDAAERSAPYYWPGCSRQLDGRNVHYGGYYWVLYYIAC
jgi:hypothetical protein